MREHDVPGENAQDSQRDVLSRLLMGSGHARAQWLGMTFVQPAHKAAGQTLLHTQDCFLHKGSAAGSRGCPVHCAPLSVHCAAPRKDGAETRVQAVSTRQQRHGGPCTPALVLCYVQPEKRWEASVNILLF